MGMAVLSNMHVPSSVQAYSCHQSNAYFEGISLERVLADLTALTLHGMLSIDVLAVSVKTVVHVSKSFIEILSRTVENCDKVKDLQKFSAIRNNSIKFLVQYNKFC